MRVCFVTEGNLQSFTNDGYSADADAVVFGFNGLNIVHYKSELEGEESGLEDLARLSYDLDCVVMSGCDTDTYGNYRHSVAVADRGRLLGVSDALYEPIGSEFKCGYGLRVYDTSAGRLGILVGEDIFNPMLFQSLAESEADVIFAITKRIDSFVPEMMIRTGSYCHGVTSCLCSAGYASVATVDAEILIRGTRKFLTAEVPVNRNYGVITYKKRCSNKINV